MKKLAATTIATAALLAAASSQAAGTVTQGVDVKVNLTAACQIQGGPITPNPVVDFGVYTAFQATSVTATVTPQPTITIECTRGHAVPTYSFDGGTGYGVIAGLNYEVTAIPSIVTAGAAATAAAGRIGSGDTYTVTLGGTMAANQAGAGAGGAAAPVTRTLTITY